MNDIRTLLEKINQFAGQDVGQKPGDQVRGTEKALKGKDHPFKGRLVGAAESTGSLLKELEKELHRPEVKEKRDLMQEFRMFKETSLRDKEDLQAKRKALQDIQLDRNTHKDPELQAELIRRRDQLEKEAKAKGFKESKNAADSVKLDVPLLIRLLEYAREDAQGDLDLHNVAEKLIELSTSGETLNMDHYEDIVGQLDEYGGVGGVGSVPQSPQGTSTDQASTDPKVKQAQSDAKNINKTIQGLKTGITSQGGDDLNQNKLVQTLNKTNVEPTTQLTNPEEKQVAQFAPALSNILKNPQTAGQFKQLVNKAGTMDQAVDKKAQQQDQPMGTNPSMQQQQQNQQQAKPGQPTPAGQTK